MMADRWRPSWLAITSFITSQEPPATAIAIGRHQAVVMR